MLMDEPDAERERLTRTLDRLATAIDPDLALVGMHQAIEHADQGRLARAVLAEQRVNLPRRKLQAGAAQRHGASEALVDVAERDVRHCSEPRARNL